MTDDPIRAFLKERGVGGHVVRGGPRRLETQWSAAVAAVTRGEAVDLDDYLNDMDGRNLIDLIEERFPGATNTANDDDRFLGAVKRSHACLWGEETARKNGWTEDRQWWYFHELPPCVEK